MIRYKGTRAGDLKRGNNPGVDSATIVHVYHADNGEDEFDILNQPQLPVYNQTHPRAKALSNTGLHVSRVDGTKKNLVYEVECTYERLEAEGINVDPGEREVLPWNAPVFNFSILPVDNILPFDLAYKNGDGQGSPSKPVVSSSGTPLGANTNKPNISLKFSYYLRSVRDSWAIDYYNTVNASGVTVANVYIAKGTGLLRSFGSSLKRTYNEDGSLKYTYYQVDVEIEIRSEGWSRQLADMSVFMLSGGSPARIYHDGVGKYPESTFGFGTREQIFKAIDDSSLSESEKDEAKDGVQPVDEPVTLDGESGSLSFTSGGKFKPEYIKFNEFYAKSWGSLNLPHSRD